MPTASRSTVLQTTPARPSISPLSTASKPSASSPITSRNATMPNTVAIQQDDADGTSDLDDAEIGEIEDDRSSSLSELEQDGLEEHAIDDEDADSEAETERLEPTPQKLRRTTEELGKSHSKLGQAATADDELSDPPSPLATGVGAASSTSTVATVGQKRKRSDSPLTSADSELGESPRKKAHESPTHALEEADDTSDHVEQSAESRDRTAADTPALEDALETYPAPVKIVKRKGGRRKKIKEPTEEQELEVNADLVEPEEEPSEEKKAVTEEELKAKKEASSDYDSITKKFKFFREKLNGEQFVALEAELATLSHSNLVHPEFLRQAACVDARLQKQKSEAQAFYNYRLRCLRDRALGERSQLHSQYYQSVREVREEVLYKLGEDWHAIQKERRQSHQEQDDAHLYKFPTDKKVQKRIQAKYNQEVSVLSGMAKWVGFPAAPTISGVEGDGFEEDMKKMKISKRVNVHQSAAPPPRPQVTPAYYAGPSVSEQETRLAHERYLEQNAWARPQAPMHTHVAPAISHTPDWAEQPSTVAHSTAKHFIRNLSNPLHRTASPFATPLAQKRPLVDQISSAGTLPMNSDGAEPPSSVLAVPPTTGRIELINQASSNQTSPMTLPKQRLPGPSGQYGHGHELTGFRNISAISAISALSGTSTIDAPPEHEHAHPSQRRFDHEHQLVDRRHEPEHPIYDRRPEYSKAGPGPGIPHLMHASSASHSVFDTSQLHRHPQGEMGEVYPNAGFRLQEGAFGTPAPMPGMPPGDGRA